VDLQAKRVSGPRVSLKE